MAPIFKKTTPFKLRARARNRKCQSNDIHFRMELIDRIAALRGVETIDHRVDTVPRQIDVYLKHDGADGARRTQSPPMLCSLNSNGLMVSGLDRWARHHVASRGWGRPIFDQMLIFLPRDNKELDVVWKILRRAYDNLYVSSAREPGSQIVSTWDSPKSLRTTLH